MQRVLGEAWAAQAGRWSYWVPVALAFGIGGYFALPREPLLWEAGMAAGAALLGATVAIWPKWRVPALALTLVLLGALLAGLRAHSVAGPVLGFRYYGPIEGRIVAIDRSFSEKPRLTLDQVTLLRMDPADIPLRVRVSLHGDQVLDPKPGMRVMMTGHLSPPRGPVEPGGFDFRRHAWFQGIGAVGYTRNPALMVAPAGAALPVARVRSALSAGLRDRLPGETGAVAAAISTGDRSGIGQAVLDDLRATNLAHLLAISGLHMGLLTGLVFFVTRASLAAIPFVALRWPIKKIAAVLALVAGACYLVLSGGAIATERAFIMAAVMLSAILLDRRAISLRAVAIAATLVLVLRPEALLGPGFQMSFAATVALVAVFGWIRDAQTVKAPPILRGFLSLLISSAVAGLATAPFGAAHFNQFTHYGLIANLVSVPVMGAVVMPGALAAAILAPIGAEWIGLLAMEIGLGWILWVAATVAGWPEAVSKIPAPSAWVLPLISFGALWGMLWAGPGRWLGLAPMAVAGGLWISAERPALLIADSGGLMGVMTPEGRALSKERGDGFSASTWLENDGDAADQAQAFARWQGDETVAQVAGQSFVLIRGRDAEARAIAACRSHDWVIVAKPVTGGPCQMLDTGRLRRTGAIAVHGGDGLRVVTAADHTGRRIWTAP